MDNNKCFDYILNNIFYNNQYNLDIKSILNITLINNRLYNDFQIHHYEFIKDNMELLYKINDVKFVDKIIKTLKLTLDDIRIQDNEGFNALMIASENGHLDIVKYFIEQGLTLDDIRIQNNFGYNALILASKKGYLDVVKYLKEKIKELEGNQ